MQGDPLGPLHVCMDLHKVVTVIAADSIFLQFSFHAWYMDDGVIAACPAYTIFQSCDCYVVQLQQTKCHLNAAFGG